MVSKVVFFFVIIVLKEVVRNVCRLGLLWWCWWIGWGWCELVKVIR